MARRESSEPSSGDGKVTLSISGAVAHILFDRPWARNAMTWAMYDGLAAACAAINGNSRVRVAVLRGAGGNAFVTGTDIAQFREFANGDDGVGLRSEARWLYRHAGAPERTQHRRGRRLRGRGRPRHRECLRYPYRRLRCAVRGSNRAHLGQLPFGCQSPSALRHSGSELGEKNVTARRDADG